MKNRFLLIYSVFNHGLWQWEDKDMWFNTREELVEFVNEIKKGTMILSSEDIDIKCAYEAIRIDI